MNFIEGKNLGITKHKIKIEASFSSKKPLSFTTKIEFADDCDNIFTIYISGTADNCLFTNFSYFQRSFGEYKLKLSEGNEGGNIIVQEEDDDLNSNDGKGNKKKAVISTQSHSSTRSHIHTLGY